MIRIITNVATEMKVFTGDPTGKTQTNIYVFIFLKSLLWNTVFPIGSRKQYAPTGGRTKMEMKGHCDILLSNSLSISNHQEQGIWHYSFFKNTELFLNPHLKTTQFTPHTSSRLVFRLLCNKRSRRLSEKGRNSTHGRRFFYQNHHFSSNLHA